MLICLSIAAVAASVEVARRVRAKALGRWQRERAELKAALARSITKRLDARRDADQAIAALRRQLVHLERMRSTGLWVAEQESAFRDLKQTLDGGQPV